MLYLFVGIAGILMGLFGIVSNLYILLVITFSKKARSISEWILLHLSSCGIVASILTLCFSSPSIIFGKWISSFQSLCDVVGASILTLQLLTVWSICALSVDRCSAIVSPLRYTQVVTRRRVAAFFITFWCLSITMIVMAFSFSSSSYSFSSPFELPENNNNVQTFDLLHFQSRSNEIPATPSPPMMLPSSDLIYTTNNNNNNNNNNNSSIFLHSLTSHYQLYSSDDKYQFSTDISTQHRQQQNNDLLDFYFPKQKQQRKSVIKTLSKSLRNEEDGENDENNNNNMSNNNNVGDYYNSNNIDDNDNYSSGDEEYYKTGESETKVVTKNSIPSSYRKNFTKTYRSSLGFCLPNIYYMSWMSLLWVGEWTVLIFIAPLCTLLICDLTVLSIAKKQRHRIVMALYQITLSAQATVTRSKGTAPPSLWMTSQTVPAKSRAYRAVWEDVATIIFLNLPLIIILVTESLFLDGPVPITLTYMGSLSFFLTPSFTSLLHGIRARPLRTAYKSYLRKRLTNSTLQHEIEQRLSPVDGSPRASSRAKSFRSSTPSPNSSPFQTPHRRLSTNDLRPPTQFSLTLSPSHYEIASANNEINHKENNCTIKPRKVRSFLHIPSQQDMQEFWSSLRKPNRSPTIIITHELRSSRQSNNSSFSSRSSTPPFNAEHLV